MSTAGPKPTETVRSATGGRQLKAQQGVFSGVKRKGGKGVGGGRWARGNGERYIGSEGKGRGKKLAELVMYDLGMEEVSVLGGEKYFFFFFGGVLLCV